MKKTADLGRAEFLFNTEASPRHLLLTALHRSPQRITRFYYRATNKEEGIWIRVTWKTLGSGCSQTICMILHESYLIYFK